MTRFLLSIILISSSMASAGTCDCPSDVKSNNAICGEGSAFCIPGGYEPMCGAKNDEERAALYKMLCPNKYAKIKMILKLK